ncbi:MAG: SPOR domain-containing protein [Thermaurantimonas sp.]|uniref:SPOR domain-containing protein n=1 Tax=Thermaurantimonas sp. TaxID=2681568 RepID=UPI003919B0D0
MDKTVSRTTYDEHLSLMWVLNYNRFVKPDKNRYIKSEDYWGFFPVNRPQFKVRDLSLYSDEQLDSIAEYYDAFYYTDAYGVYSNEWYLKGSINERSTLIYGGANFSEVTVMEKMFQQRKLLIGEFNLVASPTPYDVRKALEDLFQFRYTGWTLRYYDELDTAKNPDIPKWMIRLHNESQDRPWDYKGPGLAYVNENGIVFVLTKKDDLISEVPVINTKRAYAQYYGLPEYLRYPFWQDVVIPYAEENVIANYRVHPNERGDSFLMYYRIPKIYPAVIGDTAEGLRFYFCGDYSDNPFGFLTAYFKGITYIRKLFYNNQDYNDRRKFFWEYYQPLVRKILHDYYFRKDRIDRSTLRPLPKRASRRRSGGYIPEVKNIQAELADKKLKIDLTPSPLPYGLRKMQALLYQETKAEVTPTSEQITFEDNQQALPTTRSEEKLKQNTAEESTKEKDIKSSSEVTDKKPARSPSNTEKPLRETPKAEEKPAQTTTAKEQRTMPTLQTPKEKPSDTPVESEKPYVSQKAFIDRLVVLTRSGAFVRGRDYFKDASANNGNTSYSQLSTAQGISSAVSKSAGQGWKLIVASFTSEENAKLFVAGRSEFEIVKIPGTPYFRIAVKTYATLREAKADIANIKSSYPDAWLLRI